MAEQARARIVPNIVRSQYSQQPNMLDGFNLIIKDGRKLHFSSREAAIQYADDHNFKLVYTSRK